MTFFYDMNKKLKEVLEAPKSVNQQLNERDEGKHNNATTGFKALAAKAAKEYGSKAAGERVAGAVRNKMKKAGKLEEQDIEEGIRDMMATLGAKAKGLKANITKNPADRQAAIDAHRGIMKKELSKVQPGDRREIEGPSERYRKAQNSASMHKIGLDNNMEEGMFDSLKAGMAKAGTVAKKVGGKALDTLGHGSDEQMRKDLQKKMGLLPTGKKPMGEEYGPLESAGGTPMTPKQKKFAKLAPPADKITFADKIAGAKKEVDEMLGDVAAEAMRGALKGGQKKLDKNHNGRLDAQDFAMLRAGKGKKVVADEGWDDMLKDVEKRRQSMKPGEKIQGHKGEIEKTATGIRHTRKYDPKTGETDTGDSSDAQPVKRGRGRPKKADKAPERVTAKAYKHKGGRVAEQGEEELDELSPETIASYQKKAYPQAAAAGPKSDQRAAGVARSLGRTTSEGEEELDEKAVSKKQQKFMGMVHAAQKGEKPASKEVAKVAKTMKKKDAEDFASTKHKGLPEKVKSKKKEKTEESDAAPTSGKGLQFGKGIYDSLNREIENLIAESMSINASDSTDGTKSLTITATDDDAVKLADIMRNAGVGGAAPEAHGEIEVVGTQSPISGDEGHDHSEPCETCGSADCGCGDIEEALDENEPNWPTEQETSDDALQYSGGLNGPKSTGQTTVPVIAHQGQRTGVDDEALRRMMEMAGLQSQLQPWERTMKEEAEEELDEQEQVVSSESVEESKEMCEVCEATPCKCDESVEESIATLRGLAGIQEAAKPDFLDVDKDGDKKESMKKAADDAEKDKKVEESIFKMSNLWKAYKG